jgi:hypothetical protein
MSMSTHDAGLSADRGPTLIVRLLQQLMTLLSKEAELARAEMSEKFRKLAAAGASVAIALAFLIGGIVALTQACVMLLVEAGLTPFWATVIVAAVELGLGFILLASALSAVRNMDVAPTRAIRQVREDATLAKEQTR